MAINLVISIFEYLIHKNFMLVQPYCLEPWIPRMAMEIGATGPSKYHSNPFELVWLEEQKASVQLGTYSLISPDFEVLCNHRAFNCNRIANNKKNNPTIGCFSTYQAGTTLLSCANLLLSSHSYLHVHSCALEASGFAVLICNFLPSHM